MEQPSTTTSDLDFDPAYTDQEPEFTLVSSDGVAFKVYRYYLQAHSTVFRDSHDMLEDANDPKPDMDGVYNDPDADLTLISSDNIAFKIYTYHLGTSPVLVDMVKSLPCSDSIISFSDPQMEDSDAIRYILNILHNRHSLLDVDHLGIFRNTIAFVKKYEMLLLEPYLAYQLQRYLDNNGGKARYVFILAAELDNVSIAAAAIQKGAQGIFVQNNAKSFPDKWFTREQLNERERLKPHVRWGFVDGSWMMDPAAWPLWELRRVPFDYLSALIRTHAKFPFGQDKSDDQDAAEYFIRLMDDLKI